VSRAFTLLFAGRPAASPQAGRPEERARRAIGRLVSLEGARGGFAAWSARGERELWLTA